MQAKKLLILVVLSLFVPPQAADGSSFIRGDVDRNSKLEVTDAVAILNFLFLGDPATLECEDAADVDDTGAVEVTDGIYLLRFLFAGGASPVAPFPEHGFDLTADDPFVCGDVIGGPRRPVDLHVPATYDPSRPIPLVLLLHAYMVNGSWQENYMKFRPLADSATQPFLFAHPEGLVDSEGKPFWNATESCCDFDETNVDDSTYLRSVIDGVKRHYNVDPKRVYIVGLSNGGFMAHRMACDHPEVLAAVASMSGSTFLEAERCNPVSPVHVLEVHGTADSVAPFAGGCVPARFHQNIAAGSHCFPGSTETIERWATYNECSLVAGEASERLDLDSGIPGSETRIIRYANECSPGGSAELWQIDGAGHVPPLLGNGQSTEFAARVIAWLFAHPKP